MLPRLIATGVWLVVTVGLTAMVWTATSIVAADVTDRPASVVPHQDVVSALESNPSVVGTTTTTTVPRAGVSASTVPARGPGGGPANPNAPAATTPAQNPSPGVSIAPPPPTTVTTTPATPPTTTRPSPTTTLPPSRPAATYSTSGGVVSVACNGLFIDLVAAIPANGYAVNVVDAGPAKVEVHFVRSRQAVSVRAVCFGQPIRY